MIELKWTLAAESEPGLRIEGRKVKLQYRDICCMPSGTWLTAGMDDLRKQPEEVFRANPPQEEIYVPKRYYGAPYDD